MNTANFSDWKPKTGDIVQFDKKSFLQLVVDVHYPFGLKSPAWVVLMGPRGLTGPMSIQGFNKVSMQVKYD